MCSSLRTEIDTYFSDIFQDKGYKFVECWCKIVTNLRSDQYATSNLRKLNFYL